MFKLKKNNQKLNKMESVSKAVKLWNNTSRLALFGTMLVFLVLMAAGVSIPMVAQAAVYLIGMVALNLPHGGFEHFSNLRRRGVNFSLRYVLGFVGFISVFVLLFYFKPLIGLSLALVVAMAKGGGGDVKAMDATTGSGHLHTRWQRYLAIAARGLPIMFVPIVFHAEDFRFFSELMINMFEPGRLETVNLLLAYSQPVFGLLVLVVIITHLLSGFVSAKKMMMVDESAFVHWLFDVLDTLILLTFFAVVPVVVAVGIYFPFWYSARQVARSVSLEQDIKPDKGALFANLDKMEPKKVALYAWLILMVGAFATLSAAAVVWAVVPNPLIHSEWLYTGVAFWSIFISMIALPHVIVGEILDKRRGIWFVPGKTYWHPN